MHASDIQCIAARVILEEIVFFWVNITSLGFAVKHLSFIQGFILKCMFADIILHKARACTVSAFSHMGGRPPVTSDVGR